MIQREKENYKDAQSFQNKASISLYIDIKYKIQLLETGRCFMKIQILPYVLFSHALLLLQAAVPFQLFQFLIIAIHMRLQLIQALFLLILIAI